MLGGASGALLGHELGGEDLVTTLGAMLLGTAAGYYGEKVLGHRRSKAEMRERGERVHIFEHRQYRSSADIREQARFRDRERELRERAKGKAREEEERDRLRAAKRNGSRHRSHSQHRRRRDYESDYFRSGGEEAGSRRRTSDAEPFFSSSGPESPRDPYPSLRRERSVRFNDETSSVARRRRKSRQRGGSRRRSRREYGRGERSSDED
jgi:hypothetical protein